MFEKDIVWWYIKSNGPIDIVFVCFKDDNVIRLYPFKRPQSFCFVDQKNEYHTVYCPHVGFIRMVAELNKKTKNGYIRKRAA